MGRRSCNCSTPDPPLGDHLTPACLPACCGLAQALRAGAVKDNQVNQCVVMRGVPSEAAQLAPSTKTSTPTFCWLHSIAQLAMAKPMQHGSVLPS